MYNVEADKTLTPLVETKYERELDLQELLASYAPLLAGDQMTPGSPRRFVLITDQAGIAISENGATYFSLDLLFLDQNAVPTLVEVKRSADTRARREVVGQLLEYATNACAFWTSETIRASFQAQCLKQRKDPDLVLAEHLGLEVSDCEAFWQQLAENLRLERLRLVFVADSWSVETQRIVEFLNRHMDCDVHAVEVKQFSGRNSKTLVSRVINPSVAESERKSANSYKPGETWTEERFYSELENNVGLASVNLFRSIQRDLLELNRVRPFYGAGKTLGSIIMTYMGDRDAVIYKSGRDAVFCTLWTNGIIELDIQYVLNYPPFDRVEVRNDYISRITQIPGVTIPDDRRDKRPGISWSLLQDPSSKAQFISAQTWLVDQLALSDASSLR